MPSCLLTQLATRFRVTSGLSLLLLLLAGRTPGVRAAVSPSPDAQAVGPPARGTPAYLIDSVRTRLYGSGEPDTNRFKCTQRLARMWADANPDSALRYARLGIVLARRTGIVAKQAHAQINLANVLRLGADLPATQRAYEAGLRLARQAHNPEAIGNAYSGLGSLALQVSDLVGAQHYYEQSEAAYKAAKPPLRASLATASYNLADVYFNLKQLPRARQKANQGLALLTPADHPAKRAALLFVVARIQLKEHKPDSASRTFTEVRQLAEMVGDLAGAGESTRGQAEAALARHQAALALRYAQEAEAMLQQAGNEDGYNEAQFVKAVAMNELHLPGAFELLRRHIVRLDTLHFQQRAAEVSQAQARFDAAGRQAQIDKLEQQRRIGQLEAGQQAIRTRALIAIVASLLLLLAGGAYFYLRLRRTSAALAISEAQARAAEADARKANATKDQLMSIIGHDLRSPVATFQQVTPLLAHYADSPDPVAMRKVVASLDGSAHHLGALLDNLLHWARAEAGTTLSRPQALPVGEVVTRATAPYAAGAALKGISLTADLDPALTVWADADLLQTVLRNLVSNALKFTPKGGQVTVRVKPAGEQEVALEVQDTGVGIPPARVTKLFEAGATTSTTGTGGEPGTGLGLPLSARFVQELGSTLQVESALGAGTTFCFRLPVAVGSPQLARP